jgi:hypothetical protein
MRSNGFRQAMRFGSFLVVRRYRPKIPRRVFGYLTRQPNATAAARVPGDSRHETEAGRERTFTVVAALIDTNILVYRFDDRFPERQRIATDTLRRGILENSVRVPHQAIVEFIAAVTKPIRGYAILSQVDALREAEGFCCDLPFSIRTR